MQNEVGNTKQLEIPCHCCGGSVHIARAVKIRGDATADSAAIKARFPDPNVLSPEQDCEFQKASIQYERNAEFRTAFICSACYTRLDNACGVAEIVTDHGVHKFNLAGESRRSRAPVYDYAKWSKYQVKKAAEIGVDASSADDIAGGAL
jgi:hypothetical protein